QRRRLRLVDATSQIVVGTVARAEITTYPVLAQIRRCHFWTEGRRATQVCADTDQQQNLWLDRTCFRVDISRLCRVLGGRVSELALDLLKIPQDFLGSADNEHRLTAPLSNHLLPWLDFADIHL